MKGQFARMLACVAVTIGSTACVIPSVFPVTTLAPNASVDSTGRQVRVRVGAPPDVAASQLVQALVERDIPVSTNSGGVLEAKLPRQFGLLGQYEIVVRGYVSPAEGGSSILLYAEEGSYHFKDLPAIWAKVGSFSEGRALATWKKLEEVGRVLGQ